MQISQNNFGTPFRKDSFNHCVVHLVHLYVTKFKVIKTFMDGKERKKERNVFFCVCVNLVNFLFWPQVKFVHFVMEQKFFFPSSSFAFLPKWHSHRAEKF